MSTSDRVVKAMTDRIAKLEADKAELQLRCQYMAHTWDAAAVDYAKDLASALRYQLELVDDKAELLEALQECCDAGTHDDAYLSRYRAIIAKHDKA